MIEFPAFMSEQWLNKGEWYMDLVASKETMSFLTPVSYLSLKIYNTMFFQLDLKKYPHIEPHNL